ncbi:ComEA family DNA-binding protein [Acidovorax sp. NCPPB 4044]|uniref:ComEA family DNA-binding protein n=1 Tax=Acidovorax sp. NCPPB 4044 TaxID=2940490 RepID=UPI0023030280|nr:helix-hairpin-helix domain-containing protein [Acidovorax sp. NCPPB 4044]MDA8520581.1 helix-hairpin-helix domain-containing protein [Acidovorax sp. NCPPB 4044]
MNRGPGRPANAGQRFRAGRVLGLGRTAAALALCAGLWPAAACATDVNTASVAELDGIRGIGPAMSRRILQARAQAPFTDWQDLIARVPGLGRQSAARLSQEGLTVGGAALAPLPAPLPKASRAGAGTGP